MNRELKLNQCQDCGCPGAQLLIELIDYGKFQATCPGCGRKGSIIVTSSGISTPMYYKLLENSWNPYNRENKEGLG